MARFERLSDSDNLKRRTEELAQAFADDIATELAGRLAGSPDGPDAEEAEVTVREASADAYRGKLAGDYNDIQSRAPGLTAYVTEAAGRRLGLLTAPEGSGDFGHPFLPPKAKPAPDTALQGQNSFQRAPHLSEVDVPAGDQPLFAMNLPLGVYHESRDIEGTVDGIVFYPAGSVGDDGEFSDLFDGFKIPKTDIAYIHGLAKGELWVGPAADVQDFEDTEQAA